MSASITNKINNDKIIDSNNRTINLSWSKSEFLSKSKNFNNLFKSNCHSI